MNLKPETLRSTKLRAAARRPGNSCIRCGSSDGTICGRHYNGQRQHTFGKGGSQKVDDFLIADLCNDCDAEFTEGVVAKSDIAGRDAYSEEFLTLCVLTLIRRRDEGVLKVA